MFLYKDIAGIMGNKLSIISYEEKIFNEFESLLKENISSSRMVKHYAEKLSLSPKKLNAVIKSFSGKTAKEFIEDRIIYYSTNLLRDRSITVKQISYMLGFTEPTNFNKFFKKHTSITPQQFRMKYIK